MRTFIRRTVSVHAADATGESHAEITRRVTCLKSLVGRRFEAGVTRAMARLACDGDRRGDSLARRSRHDVEARRRAVRRVAHQERALREIEPSVRWARRPTLERHHLEQARCAVTAVESAASPTRKSASPLESQWRVPALAAIGERGQRPTGLTAALEPAT